MKSIFNPEDNAGIINRLKKLTPEHKALWGKMTVNQMLAHLQPPIQVAVGALPLKQSIIGFLFGKWALKTLDGEKPFNKNLPTAPEFVIKNQPDFAVEHANVLRMVQRYADEGPGLITTNPHPFFGKMTLTQWDNLQWKHLDHHLRQFGE